jgi:hypothetical protein
MVGLRRPGKSFCVGEGRRPARQRLRRPISIGVKAFGRWSACADREVSFASAEADAWRGAPGKADFNRREGLRPMVGLRRPGGVFCVGGGRRLARCAWEGRFQSA